MKMRVTTSGAGKMRIWAAFSYDACATKRRATYSCSSKPGNQYLRGRPRPNNRVPEVIERVSVRFRNKFLVYSLGREEKMRALKEQGFAW